MIGIITPLFCLETALLIAVIVRLALLTGDGHKRAGIIQRGNSATGRAVSYGLAQTTGNQVLQSDCAQAAISRAGIMAVLADGIGKENTGKVCAQIAVDTILDGYEPYRVLNNPEYFFRSTFHEANLRIQKTIEERKGGTCLGAVFLNGTAMHYALAGDLRIALLRSGELIPISQGQTLDVLAVRAYEAGRLSRKEAIWSMEEKRAWNYVGMDGFHEIEIAERPIRLKAGDLVFMASKGIWQELSWAEIEDILTEPTGLQEKAERLVAEADRKPGASKENGSTLIIKAEVSNETDQF